MILDPVIPEQVKGPVRYGSQMRILISGAGIAGLALAGLLRQRGFHPTIVEKAPGFGDVGYVLGIWPAGGRILRALGVFETFLSEGEPFDTYQVLSEKGALLGNYSLKEIDAHFGPTRALYRPELISLLAGTVPPDSIKFATKIVDVNQNDEEVAVTFSSGEKETYDLVVLADGLRSEMRSLVFGGQDLTYSGMTGWSFWVNNVPLPPQTVQEYWGQHAFCGVYPAKGRTCAILATHRPSQSVKEVSIEEIRTLFQSFGGLIPEILREVKDPSQIFWDDLNDFKTKNWVKKRVVLVGDAAHAILPTGGVGASMALESAFVLAEELCRSDSRYINQALADYVKRRKRRVDHIQDQSRSYGKLMFTENAFMASLRNFLIPKMGSRPLFKFWEKIFNETI